MINHLPENGKSSYNFKTTNVPSKKARMDIVNGHYIVFNGWKNYRRQEIFSTYNKWEAEEELAKRKLNI